MDAEDGSTPAPLDAFSACAAISAHARAGRCAEALELLGPREQPDAACYHAGLHACERAARPTMRGASSMR